MSPDARIERNVEGSVAVEVGIQALDTPMDMVHAFKQALNALLHKKGYGVKVQWVDAPAKWNVLLHMPGQRLVPSRVLQHLRSGTLEGPSGVCFPQL